MKTLRADRLQPSQRFNHFLGQRISETRRALSWTQRELAGHTLLRPDLLSKYESGTHPPSVRTLHRIAQALGKPVDSLLPELTLTEEADRDLYRLFREIWFLPLESRRIVASILTSIFTFPTLPLAQGVAAGERHASRR